MYFSVINLIDFVNGRTWAEGVPKIWWTSGTQKEEVRGDWRIFHDGPHELHSSPNILMVIKLGRKKLARLGETRDACRIFWRNTELQKTL